MAFSARQARLYVYTVDIWRQVTPPPGTDFGTYHLLTSGVPCLFVAGRAEARVTPLGRTQEAEAAVLDRFGFGVAVDVKDTDCLHLTTAPDASPDVGRWFAVHGNPQRQAWRANRLRVLAKGCPAPPGAV